MTLATNLKIKVAGASNATPATACARRHRGARARPLPSVCSDAAAPVSRNLLANFPAEIQCAICNRRGKASERRFSRVAEIANDVVLGARDDPIIILTLTDIDDRESVAVKVLAIK